MQEHLAFFDKATRIEEYFSHSQEAVLLLEERGLKPCGIIPSATWNKICKSNGLIRLHPDTNGNVRVKAPPIGDMLRDNVIIWGFTRCGWVIMIGVVISSMFLILSSTIEALGIMSKERSVCVFFSGVFVAIFLLIYENICIDSQGGIEKWAEKKGKAVWGSRKYGKFVQTLFPNGHDQHNGGTSTRLILPDPPPQIVEIFKKTDGLSLELAIESEVIDFEYNPISLVVTRKPKNRIDIYPIPCWAYKDLIILLRPLGDSQIEKNISKQICNPKTVEF